ncbi:MAG: insulinase family protein [Helicobacteraceae bacterium]|nr:insulinase family protein [Helicobacteraceae bacterium]
MAAVIEKVNVKDIEVPLIYEEDKRLPIVTIKVVFRVSGSSQDEKNSGLAKLSAKMMSEGTLKKGAIAFAEELDSKAIHLGVGAGVETFSFDIDVLKDEYTSAVDLFKELLEDPNLSKKTLEKVKKITIGSLTRKENDFDYTASAELKKLLFSGTLSEPQLGTIESVENIKLSEVKKFLKDHLVISRAMVVIGGDISLSEAKAAMKSILKLLAKGKSSELMHQIASSSEKESVLERKTEQAYIYFGAPYNMDKNSKEYYKARVSMFVLGAGGFGSRLMEEIRVKRGLAYSAYCYTRITKSTSSFNGHMQTKLDSMDEAKKVTQEVISNFVKNGITAKELDQAKKYLQGSEPLRTETLAQRLGRTFGEYYDGLPLGNSAIELEKIAKLTLEDINKFIKEHSEINKLSFAIVTNESKKK